MNETVESKGIVHTLVQYASWPLVFLILILLFRGEMGEMLSSASSLKAGGVELAFHDKLQVENLPKDQLKIIQNLTADEIELYLFVTFNDASNDFRYKTGNIAVDFAKTMHKFQDAGLIKINQEDKTGIYHITTSLGKRIRSLLIYSVVEVIRGRNKHGSSD